MTRRLLFAKAALLAVGMSIAGSGSSAAGGTPKKTVLLLGRTQTVLDEVLSQLDRPDIEFHTGTGIEAVRTVFDRAAVDHVIMGAGLDLEVRLAIVHEVYTRSAITTVHMKDTVTGAQGMLPFVRAILAALV